MNDSSKMAQVVQFDPRCGPGVVSNCALLAVISVELAISLHAFAECPWHGNCCTDVTGYLADIPALHIIMVLRQFIFIKF